jgi:hypothetical protein
MVSNLPLVGPFLAALQEILIIMDITTARCATIENKSASPIHKLISQVKKQLDVWKPNTE